MPPFDFAQGDKVCKQTLSRGGAVVARMAHNHEVAGANPAPATMKSDSSFLTGHFSLSLARDLHR